MILITGATGFVGKHITKHLLAKEFSLRILVREKTYQNQFVNQKVELVYGDVTEPETLKKAVLNVDTIIHCVGILQEIGKNITHQKIVVQGTKNLLTAAQSANLKKFIYLSGLGTSSEAKSKYHQGKWLAEEAIRNSGFPFIIFRPSVIFASDDNFLNLFYKQFQWSPILPILGSGNNLMQPISVYNVAEYVEMALTNFNLKDKVYEIGGPEIYKFDEIMDLLAKTLNWKKPKVHLPLSLVEKIIPLMPAVLPLLKLFSKKPALDKDLLLMLQNNNICKDFSASEQFKIKLIPLLEGIQEYEFVKRRLQKRWQGLKG